MGAGCVARNGGEGRRKRVAEHGLAQQIINTEFGTSSFERSSSFRHFPAANGNFRVHAACMYVCIRCGNCRCAIKPIRGALNSARKRPGTDMVLFEKQGSTRLEIRHERVIKKNRFLRVKEITTSSVTYTCRTIIK